MNYQLLADAVLILHAGVVLFVVGGLVAVPVGNRLRWRWVNAWWYRATHLAAIAFIALQAWLGELCPLTTLESWLRLRAGADGYRGSFIEHWLQRLLYIDAPEWAFTAAYTGFALLVVLAWRRYPPRRRRTVENRPSRSTSREHPTIPRRSNP